MRADKARADDDGGDDDDNEARADEMWLAAQAGDILRLQAHTGSRTGPCPSFKGYTSLAVAVLNGHVACVEHLLQFGDAFGFPLWIAAIQNDTDAARLLLSARADVTVSRYDVTRREAWPCSLRFRFRSLDLLGCVATDDRLPMMESLLAAKASARAALRYAAEGQPRAVRLLLDYGAPADSSYDDDYTALQAAASCGCTQTINILIEAKADVDAQDAHGEDACWAAAYSGHLDAARLLQDHGAVASAPYWYQWCQPDWREQCSLD